MRKIISLIMICCALFVGSCSTSKDASTVRGEWNIVSANGVSTVGGMNRAFLLFDGKGKINGNTSINSFFGTYSQKGENLTIDNQGMTRMMGPNIEMEDAVTKAINNAAKIKVEGDKATIYDAQGKAIMELQKK